jgi:DNA-binding IclR family transcriptional regulator
MKERTVRYEEQDNTHETSDSTLTVPAPMVERAFRLLDLLCVSEEGLTLSDLSRSLNMSKSSMHGLLRTLENNRAIEQMEDRRFVLGPRIYDLAQVYIQRVGLRHFALPVMHRLAAMTGETVCLGRVEQKSVRILDWVVDEEEQAGLHIALKRGMRIPLLAGAFGAFVLANLPLAQHESYLQAHPLTRYTEQSIIDPQHFLSRVEDVVLEGVSIDRGEYLEGVTAVAAPIYGGGNTLEAFLWIVGFATRFKDEVLTRAAEQLRVEAETISQALGARN